jgi:hypothetical protein
MKPVLVWRWNCTVKNFATARCEWPKCWSQHRWVFEKIVGFLRIKTLISTKLPIIFSVGTFKTTRDENGVAFSPDGVDEQRKTKKTVQKDIEKD